MSISQEMEEFISRWQDVPPIQPSRQTIVKQSFGRKGRQEIISYAKNWAYGDVQRTLNGIGEYRELRDKALNKLEQAFISYFSSPSKSKQDFDAWHDDLCQKLIAAFAQFQHKDGKIGIEYGCAQKLVNMTFKYIYCFDEIQNNISQYAQYFEHCHVALDDDILRKCCKVADPRVMNLNKVEYLKYQNTVVDYMYENKYLETFRTPFECEFRLWNELHHEK